MSRHSERLEGLLYAQAMNMAEEHMERGRQASEQIKRETQAGLQRLKEGEELRYQLEAEQLCRQILQTSKLRLDTELDRLRWAMVQDVLAEVRKRLNRLPQHPDRYHKILERFLAEAASAMPEGDLVAELDPRDIESLRGIWDSLVQRAAPGRKVSLVSLAEHTGGGMMVRTADGRLRVNNTFDGRLARMQDEMLGTIVDKLFNSGSAA